MKNNMYIVERGRPHMTLWHLCFACWTPKAKNVHSYYVIFIVFPLQPWLQVRASLWRYTQTLLVFLYLYVVSIGNTFIILFLCC